MKTRASITQRAEVLRLLTVAPRFLSLLAIVLCTSSVAHGQVTPSGGTSDRPIVQGQSIMVRWVRFFNAPLVDIYVWNANTSTRERIARDVHASGGEYAWQIPDDFQSGERYRFIVEPTTEREKRIMSRGWVHIGSVTDSEISNHEKNIATHVASDITTLERARVSVAPQPARESVRLRTNDDYTSIQVLNLQGVVLHQHELQTGERTIDLDVQEYPAGTYNIVLTSDDGRRVSTSVVVLP